MTDNRATFERHFALTLRQQARHADDSYRDPIMQARWEGYQVATPAAQPPDTRTVAQIAHEVHHTCMRIPGANFYTAAEMALEQAITIIAAPVAAQPAPGEPCSLCDGAGTLDGTAATCPNCDRTGIEPAQGERQPESARTPFCDANCTGADHHPYCTMYRG